MSRGRQPVPIGSRCPAGNGYVLIKVAPGHPCARANRDWASEHQFVVHEAGIEIPPGHHVHHRNGIRDDNRLENLEVLPPSVHQSRESLTKKTMTKPASYQRTPMETRVLLRDRDWLATAYAGASTVEIAERMHTNRELVNYWLRRHGISLRSRSDATALQHARQRTNA